MLDVSSTTTQTFPVWPFEQQRGNYDMNGRSRILRWPALLVTLALLIGCGGGGSTDTASTGASPTYTDPTHVSYADPIDVSPVDAGSADVNPIDASPSDSASGVATLSWTPPTTNLDGSVLANLAGYRIYYGTKPGDYPNVITIKGSGLSAYVIENLQPNTYYFAMTAYNTSGSESPYSNTASKTIH